MTDQIDPTCFPFMKRLFDEAEAIDTDALLAFHTGLAGISDATLDGGIPDPLKPIYNEGLAYREILLKAAHDTRSRP
ncbi:MAG: hypothetical protein WC869_00645 [Phycisphaerae bacterium]|jgi:hypothetical protein